MKELEKEITFTGEGYATTPRILKQIFRDRGVAIYSRSDARKPDQVYCYEVFKIPHVKAGHEWVKGSGKFVEEDYEFYPGAAQWGKTAWTFNNKKVAQNKAMDLVRSIKEKEENKLQSDTDGFTIKEYAEKNKLDYLEARAFVQANFKPVGQKSAGRGKPSILYA